MAIEGSSSTTVRANVGSSFYLTAYFVENSTNTTNNTSNITCRAQMYPTANGSKFDVAGAGTLRVYWHDNRENYDREIASNSFDELGYGTWSRTAEGTFNATHNDDGKLSGYVYATWTQGSTYGGYVPNSGSTNCGWTALTEIARKVSITDVTGTYTDENFNPTVKWSNNGNRVDLKIELPDYAEYAWKRVSNKQSLSSYTWSLTQSDINDILSRMTDRNTTTVRFTVVTVIGGTDTFYDWIDRTFTIVNGKPTFTNYTFKDANTTTANITGNNQLMVQGKSSLQVNISTAQKAVAKKSATMSSYSMSCAGLVASVPYTTSAISKTLGSPTSSGSQNISVSAIDSRGNTTTVNKSVTVIPYYVPQIFASGKRLNNFEASTTITFENTTNIAPITVSNTRKNNVSSFKFRYKKSGASSWQEERNVSYTVANNGKITATAITVSLDNNFQWVCQIVLADRLSTSTLDFTVDIGIPIFRIGLDGKVYNNEQPIMVSHIGQIIMSTTLNTAEKVSAIYGGTWVAWGKGRVPVGVDTSQTEFNTVSKTGGSKYLQNHNHDLRWASSTGKRVLMSYNSGSTSAYNLDWTGVNANVVNDNIMTSQPKDPTANTALTTGTSGNLQPYITCYMWRRTA